MRIVHLSDIHFSAQNADHFAQYYVKAICNDLIEMNKIKKIEAVCLTGDLVDKGGSSFEKTQESYDIFLKEFWNPIAQKVGISNEILFMIPGNHDINEKKINSFYEKGLLDEIKSVQDIDKYVTNYNTDENMGIKRQEDYKAFERKFYESSANSLVTDFESYHVINSSIGKVGFACINTSWRCSTKLADNKLMFGTVQIRRAAKYLKDNGCEFIIGLMHHPLEFFNEAEKDEAMNMLRNLDYNAVLFGHTHKGKTNFLVGNDGNLFISTARTGFSNPAQEIEKYKSGYTILDFNFDSLEVDCHYRKYIHARFEFDKDTELAKDGTHSSPIKSTNRPIAVNAVEVKPDLGLSGQNPAGLINADIDEDDVIAKAIKLFRQESEKLSYNSSKQDFAFVKHLESELYRSITIPLNDKIKNIPALQSKATESLFERIHISEVFDETILNDIQRMRDDKTKYSWYERKVIINAITLSLVVHKKFSPKKAELLIDFLTDFEDKVWENALAGLVISLLYNPNKWERFTSLKTRLKSLQNLVIVQEGLHQIEHVFRYELYKDTFFKERMYQYPFFESPINCFLPFYEKNPILESALDSQPNNVDTADFEKYLNHMPFIDSYKYVLCLSAKNDTLTRTSLKGDRYHSFMNKVNHSYIFHPYQNIIAEYYNYFNYYPESKTKDVFINTLSITQNKLKNVILGKINELEMTAEAQMHSKNYNIAIQTLLKITQIDRVHHSANWKIALCFLKKDKPDAFNALKHLNIIYSKNRTDINIILKIADCHYILKEETKELSFLKLAYSIDSKDRRAITELGGFLQQERPERRGLGNV